MAVNNVYMRNNGCFAINILVYVVKCCISKTKNGTSLSLISTIQW